MDHKQPIAIAVLQQALDANNAKIRALQAENEELQDAINQLQAPSESVTENLFVQALIAPQTKLTEILEQQEGIDESAYPLEKLRGKQRIEIAKMVAEDFDGYLATSAFRKILAKPGVLRSTRQVGSVASRVLAHSSQFERVFEGLYRLKDYSPNEKEVPSEEKTS
jgi:hypothetical protein